MCRQEAPEVEQFARQHIDTLEVIGLGSQDRLPDAVQFLLDGGTHSFTMLWDGPGTSWQQLGIAGSPAAVLFTAKGEVIQGWLGPFPQADVVALAAANA